ncbi:MAG: alpha/beta hydrolase [Verrucomicrobiota bacterium]
MADIVFLPGHWKSPATEELLRDFFEGEGHDFHAPLLTQSPRLSDQVRAYETFILNERFDEPPVLIGHGLGGMVAQLVSTAVDTGPLVLVNSLGPAREERTSLPFALDCVRMLLFTMPKKEAVAVRGWKRSCLALGLRSLVDAPLFHIRSKAVATPILVMSGYSDNIVLPSSSIRLYRNYASAEFHGFADRGHWMLEEDGHEFVHQAILDWIEALDFYRETSTEEERFIREHKQAHHGRPQLYPAKKSVSAGKRSRLFPLSHDPRSFRGGVDENANADGGTVLPR